MPISYFHTKAKTKVEFDLTKRGLGSSYGYMPIIQDQGAIDIDVRFRDGRIYPSWQDILGHLETWPHADLNITIWRWNDDGIDGDKCLLTNPRLVPKYWDYLVALTSYMHKWKTVRIHAPLFSMLAEAFAKQQILPPAPVKLQSVAIQDIGVVKNQDPIALYLRQISDHAPLLREFHIKDQTTYQLPLSHTLMHFRFTHIQEIRIDGSAGALDIYNMIRGAPRLRKGVFTQVTIPAPRQLSPITCAHLETLKIITETFDFCQDLEYNVVWLLLSAITAPRLKKLRIGFETKRAVACFHDFLARSKPPLRILELIKVEIPPRDLIKILLACPQVTELALISLEDRLTFSNEFVKGLDQVVGHPPARTLWLCPNLQTLSVNGYGIQDFSKFLLMLRDRIEMRGPLRTIRLVCPVSDGFTPNETSSGLGPEEIAQLKRLTSRYSVELVIMDGDKFEFS